MKGTTEKSGGDTEPMDLEFLIKVLDGFSRYLSGTPTYISPWSSFFKSGAWDLEKEGYLWEGKKKFLMAAVMPSKVTGQVSRTQASLAKLREYIHELRASSFGDVEAGVTGQEALNNDEMHTAMADMTKATWVSLLGVMLIMVAVSSRLSPSTDNPHISCRGLVLDIWLDGYFHRSFEYPFNCFCTDALRSRG